MAEMIQKVEVKCEYAKEIISQGKVVATNFAQPCPFGKDKVDEQCIHCKHSLETVKEYGTLEGEDEKG